MSDRKSEIRYRRRGVRAGDAEHRVNRPGIRVSSTGRVEHYAKPGVRASGGRRKSTTPPVVVLIERARAKARKHTTE